MVPPRRAPPHAPRNRTPMPSTHDHHAGGSRAEAELLGDAEPIPAGAARTDDRDGPVGIERADQLAVSGPVEHRRRAGPELEQAGRKVSGLPRRSSTRDHSFGAPSPEREGRGNMVGVDPIARAQVGDGASDPQHAIVAASERPIRLCPRASSARARGVSRAWRRISAGPSSAFALPWRRCATSRAAITRSRTTCDDSPSAPASASADGCSTVSARSIRSASAPLIRLR